MVRVAAFLPQYCDGVTTHSYACLSACEHMRDRDVEVQLHVQGTAPSGRRPFVRPAIPDWLSAAYFRADPAGVIASRLSSRRFRAALREADVAYLWAGTPEPVYACARERGVPLVVERVNCHRATSLRILDDAYRRAGLPPGHGITEASLEEERRKLALADWIFAPSPAVRDSLLEDGVPEQRILPVSYGWSRLRSSPRASPAGRAAPVFVFVGTLCIRKGAHLLVSAWEAAHVSGRLDLCGPLLPEVQAAAGAALGAPGVRLRGPVRPFSRAAEDAEVFVFPTLEEGSSLAVLEALAAGLAVLTTPMGAGEIVRDGVEGLVLDPFDRAGWVRALRALAGDRALRARLGAAARERADSFTWEAAGSRRRQALVGAMARRGATHRAPGACA